MILGIELSNWINFGILTVTALVGVLTWLGARRSAREALESQNEAVRAAGRSASAAETANTIQTRLVEIEEQRQQDSAMEATRAVLVAEVERIPRVLGSGKEIKDFHLVVRNLGVAAAERLDIRLEGKPIAEHGRAMARQPVSEMIVGARSRLHFPLTVTPDWGPPFVCELAWEDDSGMPGRWKGTLT